MTLDVEIKKRLRFYDLNFCCRIADEELHVLIGPSGGGKTTLLRMIAGLERPDEGRIRYDSEIWFDSQGKVNVPVQKRRLGYVFQEYTLFPHLNLLENVSFACNDKNEALKLMEMLGIAGLKNRKPHQVSGGERQRCAICQAVVRKPRLLLLDEPFSALDCITRRKLRDDIHVLRSQMACPIIYVTHDLTEAFALADAIWPLEEGKINKNWLRNAIVPMASARQPAKGVRLQKLAVAQ